MRGAQRLRRIFNDGDAPAAIAICDFPVRRVVTAPSSGAAGWLGPYAKASDLKDPWGHDLQYQVPGQNGKPFTLTSYGRDGAPGGTSVDADLSSE